ncbi:hypothetical protein BJY01DRAFT_96757 [Aspergillus pseudoustus]|uniref:Short-chain dehydrogenase/reductase family protein n=1 Tax=Aspergillus pseudoustus TaxID=1810923 RepID=A0ABR4KKB4_9EURO
MGFPTFVYNQLLVHPRLPPYTFADQTVIITGSNTGIGLETARHISRLGAHKVILAVRNLASGEAAKQSIETSTGRAPGTCVEVWHLDLADTHSMLAFADKALALSRLDAFIANAAVATKVFALAEGGYESSVTVNNISTFLLALTLLPKLRQTAKDHPNRFRPPHLTILTSQVHAWPQFPQWKDPRGTFVALSDEKTAKMDERYPVTKLLGVMLTRELVSQLGDDPGVIISMVETGFCDTELSRENKGIEEVAFNFWKTLFARTAEQGARTVVAGASAGKESHGTYMVNGVPAQEALGKWVQGEEGRIAQKRVWDEFGEIAEAIRPDVLKCLV